MIAFISGATSGIGEACAHELAEAGYDLILSGRREERLSELAQKLSASGKTKVKTLVFDIRENDQVIAAIDSLDPEWQAIDVLINNAGLAAGKDPIDKGSIDDWDRMMDTNVKGLLYLSKKIIPFMRERRSGDIINIASIAGKEVYPDGNVYCASKHAVDALSRAMRMDLLPYSIRVCNIAPGLVETEFSEVRFHGDKTKANAVYQGYEPLSAKDIAECVRFVLARPAHVQIGDMLILPSAQANSTMLRKD